jgi:hypothetical protein
MTQGQFRNIDLALLLELPHLLSQPVALLRRQTVIALTAIKLALGKESQEQNGRAVRIPAGHLPRRRVWEVANDLEVAGAGLELEHRDAELLRYIAWTADSLGWRLPDSIREMKACDQLVHGR